MSTGNIGITAENIFPVIKKFLYSDHDIFIREIVSNAIDATSKMSTINDIEFEGKDDIRGIRVIVNKVEKTITVSDDGIGMTKEEIEKYINQIALSGANDFFEKYKDANTTIIGHFGLGFYSSFMVSDKVEIITKSYKKGSIAQHWVCDGTPNYTIERTKKSNIGTDIIMHISDEFADEYVNLDKISKLLNQYYKFCPYSISLGNEYLKEGSETEKEISYTDVETIKPLWTRKPSELTDEDYLDFYRKVYPDKADPLFWIHLNVDFPFNLTGILYFPSIKENPIMQKTNVSLYCNQVYVTDNVSNILPEFLTLLHGVIDSPDIPLNVSRSYLQSDANVKKIDGYITNKVIGALKDIFNKDREEYIKKWESFELFLYVGLITEESLYDKVKDILLYKDIHDNYYTISEYTDLIKENQTDKNNKVVYLYTTEKNRQYTYIKQAEDLGYSVLSIENQFSAYLVNLYEHKIENSKIVRVDSDTIDKLVDKGEDTENKLSKEDTTLLIQLFSSQLRNDFDETQMSVKITSLNENTLPVMVVTNEQMRRMKEVAMQNPNVSYYAFMKYQMSVVFNSNSAVVKHILCDAKEAIGEQYEHLQKVLKDCKEQINLIDATNKDKKEEEIDQIEKDAKEQYNNKIMEINGKISNLIKNYTDGQDRIKQLLDIAYVQNGMLHGASFDEFIKRSIKIIE